jgi:hypothetical protein
MINGFVMDPDRKKMSKSRPTRALTDAGTHGFTPYGGPPGSDGTGFAV